MPREVWTACRPEQAQRSSGMGNSRGFCAGRFWAKRQKAAGRGCRTSVWAATFARHRWGAPDGRAKVGRFARRGNGFLRLGKHVRIASACKSGGLYVPFGGVFCRGLRVASQNSSVSGSGQITLSSSEGLLLIIATAT